jgi:hypothetical protein
MERDEFLEKALTKELFIAWEETGIRITHLRVNALRQRVDRPSEGERTRAILDEQPSSHLRRVDDQQTSSESDMNAWDRLSI